MYFPYKLEVWLSKQSYLHNIVLPVTNILSGYNKCVMVSHAM